VCGVKSHILDFRHCSRICKYDVPLIVPPPITDNLHQLPRSVRIVEFDEERFLPVVPSRPSVMPHQRLSNRFNGFARRKVELSIPRAEKHPSASTCNSSLCSIYARSLESDKKSIYHSLPPPTKQHFSCLTVYNPIGPSRHGTQIRDTGEYRSSHSRCFWRPCKKETCGFRSNQDITGR